jgi:two-component system, NarL family, sensor kinase
MDEGVIITVIVGTIILVLILMFALWLVFGYQKRYYRHLQEVNAIKEKYEQEILRSQLEIKEQTMKTISLEIHDNIGQVLSLANLQLTAIELENNDFVTKKINKSMEMVSKAIADLRDLAKSLNAEHMANVGLIAAVQSDLHLIEKPGLLKTTLEISGEEKRLEVSKEIIVFRIIQEALNNIIKHARATEIMVSFHFTDSSLLVTIADNGIGFDQANGNRNRGSGLRNMINRARIIHSTLDVETVPSQYTKVKLVIPFTNESK